MTMADINKIMDKGLALLNGLTGIAGSVNSLTNLGNTYQQDGMIAGLDSIGSNLASYDDIASGYAMLQNQPKYNYNQIRNADTREKVGGVLQSVGSGAMAGSTFGPWSTAIGAVTGLGAGLYGVAAGDEAARTTQDTGRLNALIATNHAMENLNASSEYTADQIHRQRVANLNAGGGKIERRQLTAKEFADRVLGRQKSRPVSASSGLVIKKCDGGTMIRIKR